MQIDYSGNPTQRTPCVLVLDASGSMSQVTTTRKTRIDELNIGLKALENALKSDDTALVRVQLGIVTVGGPSFDAEVMMDWTDATEFTAFPIKAGGATPLAKGIQLALQMVEDGKISLRKAGISYTRPWIMIITDGDPTDTEDEWRKAVNEAREAQLNKKVEIFAVGVDGADLMKLKEISDKPPLKLSGMKFEELFLWLSTSLSAASRSRPGETLQLPSTDPWRHVGI